MKPESKFWNEVKKNTPKIQWTRLESWASYGVPDLLGYNNICGFFMCELKVVTGNRPRFSPHQIMFHSTRTVRNFILIKTLAPRAVKLYESSAIHDFVTNEKEPDPVVRDSWAAIEAYLIHGPNYVGNF